MAVKTLGILLLVMAGMIFFTPATHAENIIDLKAIKTIESDGDPYAVNVGSGCYGLYQISEICLKEFNQFHRSHYGTKDLFKPAVNEMVAFWYFGRIKDMLARYQIPINTTTLIASYNWGIGHVADWAKEGMRYGELPAETRRYIEKYRGMTRAA
jgi:soluble lytic murein transglycosylase-like protein